LLQSIIKKETHLLAKDRDYLTTKNRKKNQTSFDFSNKILPVYKLLPGQPPVNAGQRDAGLLAGELLPIGPNIAGIDAVILSSSPNVCIHCVRIIFSYGVATCLLLSSPAA
jgi:hypothetical protein